MKKQSDFLDKYGNYLIFVIVVIGILLIINLFTFGLAYKIDIFNGYIDYWWTNAGYISFIFFLISLLFIYLIFRIKDKNKKIIFACIILFLGLIGKPFFYLISPDFKFYFSEYDSIEYVDDYGNLTDIDLYLEYMSKYCDNSIDGFIFMRVYREDMCGGQYVIDLNSTLEYGKVFDYANENNLSHLYKLTFYGALDFGLDKVVEDYSDDTFYGYVLNYIKTYEIIIIKNDELLLNLMKNNSKNKDILELVNLFIDNIAEMDQKNMDGLKMEKFWEILHKKVYRKLKQISEINHKIF